MRDNFGAKIFHSETKGHVLTPFFGTCQRIGEKKECQVGDNDGARKEGIGHDLMPIGHLNVFWASFDER